MRNGGRDESGPGHEQAATPAAAASEPDWEAIQSRLLEGDPVAFLTFTRLVSGFLVQLRAYDFEDEWDDLRQEVLLAVVQNARAGRLRDPRAFVGYVKIITRNKFMDRLKKRMRIREREGIPWEDEAVRSAAPEPGPEALREAGQLWEALRDLPDEQQRIVAGVYVEGKTYQEVSEDTGVPLGTLKRRLRQGLDALRGRLGGVPEEN